MDKNAATRHFAYRPTASKLVLTLVKLNHLGTVWNATELKSVTSIACDNLRILSEEVPVPIRLNMVSCTTFIHNIFMVLLGITYPNRCLVHAETQNLSAHRPDINELDVFIT